MPPKREPTPVQPYQPHFPPELLQAWRDDRLVFFCGAGISIPSGLPAFNDLAKVLAKAVCRIDVENEPKTVLESSIKYALQHKKKYDEVIGMIATLDGRGIRLEKDELKRRQNRLFEELKKILDRNDVEHSNLHEVIIKIATNGKTPRIITTNFDRLFEKIIPPDTITYTAPNLPIVRPERWKGSLVKLHGCLMGNYNDLVLTPQSYGLAYFQDGWATNFLKELFQHYCVVFVGYSLGDAVVEYILQAHGSLKNESGINLKPSYIFLPEASDVSETTHLRTRFTMMGVETLFYYSQDSKHEELEMALKRLATYCTRNPNIVESEMKRLASEKQSDPLTLKELETWLVHDNLAIKFFLNVADASWLPTLTDLLKIHFEQLLSYQSLAWTKVEPDTSKIMLWLIRHHEDTEVLKYVLQKGGFLHPQLRHTLLWGGRRQKRTGTTEEAIWDILLEGDQLIQFQGHIGVVHPLAQQLQKLDTEQALPPLLQQQILHILTPKIRIDMSRYEMRKRWRNTDVEHSEEVQTHLIQSDISNIFDVVLSERASFGVKELADSLVGRPAWLAALSVPILAHMQKMDSYFNLIGSEIHWLDNELTPLHRLAEACVDVCDKDEMLTWIGTALRDFVNKRKPLNSTVESIGLKPEENITESDFEGAWREERCNILKRWLASSDENDARFHPANNVEEHLLNKLKNSPEDYYKKTEELAQDSIHNAGWWRLLLKTCIYDASFSPDWERIAHLALEISEESQKNIIHNLCDAIKKAAAGNVHSPALSDELFWQWWNILLPLAQGRMITSEGSNISNTALNHPLGSLAQALIQRLWYDTDGKKERVITSAWEVRLDALLAPTKGVAAAWVVLANELPILLYLLPEWTKKRLVPCFDWNQEKEIPPIQAWSAFMYGPRLHESVVNVLLPYFLDGVVSNRIQQWKNGDDRLCENFISCIANIWVGGRFSEAQEDSLVNALCEHPEYAKLLLSHWKRGIQLRESDGWDKEYLAKALALLVQYKDDLIHGKAICAATEIVLSLNAEELEQHGKALIDSLAGNSEITCSYAFLRLVEKDSNPADLPIWGQPQLLLSLLVNRVGDTQFWDGDKYNALLEHLKKSGIDGEDLGFIELERAWRS
jgi:hypothetical protein